ncbi:uncharacterized protein MONOS_12280 [Monocercomonoides exilis]|uniref:uncharacterized protein n=1 Tax=Monocercomonoides exilis TaxID=2049356 RepID=UPI0035598D32|nr:hypothetical protein MONOS_12280 [Monocercomonoides exilis]|eukprot:MONOS_12280.1-p1 / transcript=MONOS_12280.1 / gene=MONOS_12280 / organism=Monocercomonoides_exilis_PA203 / gene_product=unspecified product / transcript_product=unspecified product / location=Mono_scaffold00670:6627-8709(-) / protein_length=356 / sequence_SO=supercontig / SO=protein_coding / is_pseudo=false
MEVDDDECEEDENDEKEEEEDEEEEEEEETKEERDDMGLKKDTHNKTFPHPKKPKEHTKALPGSFCEEETLPLLPPLGEQREEGGEEKRGATKHRLLGWNNDIRNYMKRGNMMNEHPSSSSSSPSSPSSPSSASNSLNIGGQPHFEHPSSSASVVIQQEECKQIPLSSSSSSSYSSSSYFSSYMISNSSNCDCDCNCFYLAAHNLRVSPTRQCCRRFPFGALVKALIALSCRQFVRNILDADRGSSSSKEQRMQTAEGRAEEQQLAVAPIEENGSEVYVSSLLAWEIIKRGTVFLFLDDDRKFARFGRNWGNHFVRALNEDVFEVNSVELLNEDMRAEGEREIGAFESFGDGADE